MGNSVKKIKTKEERRKEYNSDKISIQISKETHKKLKNYCIDNEIKMKDFIDEVILKSIKKPLK
jgi:predicted HicB family RNase H-like nuclease